MGLEVSRWVPPISSACIWEKIEICWELHMTSRSTLLGADSSVSPSWGAFRVRGAFPHLGGVQALFFPEDSRQGWAAWQQCWGPGALCGSCGHSAGHWPCSCCVFPKHTTPTRRAAWRRTGTSSPAAGLAPASSLAWPLWKRCWGRKWLNRWRHL